MVVARSRGPSHCASRSGSLWARNTRSRGASNSRVMMICGMPGSAVICVLLIVVLLLCGRVIAAGVVFLAGLQRCEQLVESLVPFVPEPLVAGQPGGHLAERFGLQVTEPGGGAAGARDEARLLQHLEVPGDRWLGYAERLGELGDGRLALGQPGQDRSTGRIRERPEHEAELVGSQHNHLILELIGYRVSQPVLPVKPSVITRRGGPSGTYSAVRRVDPTRQEPVCSSDHRPRPV